jgi:hypothetical protein
MMTTPCKGCGKPIVWGETRDGKRIPLDPRAAVYCYQEGLDGKDAVCDRALEINGTPTLRFMVSHFATCPKASEFSGRGKKGAGA